jgi:hypothetical protein
MICQCLIRKALEICRKQINTTHLDNSIQLPRLNITRSRLSLIQSSISNPNPLQFLTGIISLPIELK